MACSGSRSLGIHLKPKEPPGVAGAERPGFAKAGGELGALRPAWSHEAEPRPGFRELSENLVSETPAVRRREDVSAALRGGAESRKAAVHDTTLREPLEALR